MIARLCRLLREEVTEQLSRGSVPLTSLAKDWRKLLFPSATDDAFADGYAQAVTFGLLMARAQDIPLSDGLDRVARELRKTNTPGDSTPGQRGTGGEGAQAARPWAGRPACYAAAFNPVRIRRRRHRWRRQGGEAQAGEAVAAITNKVTTQPTPITHIKDRSVARSAR